MVCEKWSLQRLRAGSPGSVNDSGLLLFSGSLPPNLPEPDGDAHHGQAHRPRLRAAHQTRGAVGAAPVRMREAHGTRLPPVGLTLGPVPAGPPRGGAWGTGLVWIGQQQCASPSAVRPLNPCRLPLPNLRVVWPAAVFRLAVQRGPHTRSGFVSGGFFRTDRRLLGDRRRARPDLEESPHGRCKETVKAASLLARHGPGRTIGRV
jgi:hypothetical protein